LFMLLFGFCSLLVMLSILCCCALCFLTSTSLLNNLPVNPGLLRHITVYWQVFASCCLLAGQALSCRSCLGQAAPSVNCLLYAVNGVDGCCCLEQAVQYMFEEFHLSTSCTAPHVVLQMSGGWCYLCTYRCGVSPPHVRDDDCL